MSFSEILGGLGHAIAYYPRVAKALGDPCSAIALQQFLFWSYEGRVDGEGWVDAVGKDCGDQLGMSARTVTRVKNRLVDLGLIETRVSGMPARCQVRVNLDAIDSWWDDVGRTSSSLAQRVKLVSTDGQNMFGPKGKTAPLLLKELKEVRSFDEILKGGMDEIPKCKLLMPSDDELDPILREWSIQWGKDPAKTIITTRRRKSWKSVIRDGFSPSDFCKAILGMRFDDWEERQKYCDWAFAAKDVEKWVEMYESNKGKEPPPIIDTSIRVVEGVKVPVDYDWTQEDSYMAKSGYNFCLKTNSWASKEKQAVEVALDVFEEAERGEETEGGTPQAAGKKQAVGGGLNIREEAERPDEW